MRKALSCISNVSAENTWVRASARTLNTWDRMFGLTPGCRAVQEPVRAEARTHLFSDRTLLLRESILLRTGWNGCRMGDPRQSLPSALTFPQDQWMRVPIRVKSTERILSQK